MIHSMQFNYDAKDTHIVHTLLKIQEMLNQNNLRATAETEKQDLIAFKKLEPCCQLMLPNVSSNHPFEKAAKTCTLLHLEFSAQKQ